jgi:hypothetical protein
VRQYVRNVAESALMSTLTVALEPPSPLWSSLSHQPLRPFGALSPTSLFAPLELSLPPASPPLWSSLSHQPLRPFGALSPTSLFAPLELSLPPASSPLWSSLSHQPLRPFGALSPTSLSAARPPPFTPSPCPTSPCRWWRPRRWASCGATSRSWRSAGTCARVTLRRRSSASWTRGW